MSFQNNYEDPRYSGSGVTRHSQLNPNMTAANMQRQPTLGMQQPQSPMVSSLQRAPQQPAPTPPRSGMNTAATGTFGPKTNPFAGLKQRGQTDFGKGGWQGGFNAVGSMLNVKSPFGAALGIQRRAKGSQNDYSVQDASTALQRQYSNVLGRQASPEEIQSQLAGQGLKPGDNWVGQKGLQAVLNSISQSPEALARQGQEEAPINQMDNTLEDKSALVGALQPSKNAGAAQQAYQEYLSEFPEGDPEQPLDFETFAGYFDQLPQEEPESAMASALEGRRGWNNLNLDMLGESVTPMSFSGFDMERALAGGDEKSVKDAFARAASTFPTDLRGLSKQEVGAVLGSPEFHEHLAKQGIQSRPIPGSYDQIEVFTKERGWEIKDIVANAGSPDAQWWWGDVGLGTESPMAMDMDMPLGEDSESTPEQSALLSGLTGGSNWKALLDQLMSQYAKG